MPASVYTQYLTVFGVAADGVVDNAPDKQGKRLYGTRLVVASPASSSGGTVVVHGGGHTASMVAGLKALPLPLPLHVIDGGVV